jgi:hypothetical protein
MKLGLSPCGKKFEYRLEVFKCSSRSVVSEEQFVGNSVSMLHFPIVIGNLLGQRSHGTTLGALHLYCCNTLLRSDGRSGHCWLWLLNKHVG